MMVTKYIKCSELTKEIDIDCGCQRYGQIRYHIKNGITSHVTCERETKNPTYCCDRCCYFCKSECGKGFMERIRNRESTALKILIKLK